MKNITYLCILCLIPFIFSCKDNPPTETANIFQFREYISSHTHGRPSIAEPIRIDLAKPLEKYELSQEIPSEYISISPASKGQLFIENGSTLFFKPEAYLQPDTEYTISLKLDKLYPGIDNILKAYSFSFKTLQPGFKINLNNLQSYSQEWQHLEGSLEAADVISLENAKKLIQASQQGEKLAIKWPEQAMDATLFHFTIDSISRQPDDTHIDISWNGTPIKAENKGSESFAIPGLNNFKVVNLETSLEETGLLSINFSDPLDENQNFEGLVVLKGQNNLRFEVEGNVLQVYPKERIIGEASLEIFKGIKNTYGYTMKTNLVETVSFEQLKPAVKLLSQGVILPASSTTPFYFQTVNLTAVDVRVIKIYQDNVLQFLQSANLDEQNSYNIRRVGRLMAKKTIQVTDQIPSALNSWKAHALNLSDLIQADPGAIYQLEISFKKEYSAYECSIGNSSKIEGEDDNEDTYYEDSPTDEEEREKKYWDNQLYSWRHISYNWQERDNPCHPAYYHEDRFQTTNILGSNLGLIIKESANHSYDFVTTNLLNTQSEKGVKVEVYDYQQQLLGSVVSDGNGFAHFDTKRKAAFAVAKKDNNYAYSKLEDGNALSLSKFDVSGEKLEKGLKGFLYTERGVHRPGDTIHLTFALDDKANPIPSDHPVKINVIDARGNLVYQEILNSTNDPERVKNGFYYFPIPTDASAPTGNWHAKVSVGGAHFSKTLKVATVKPNRLKIKIDFKDEILNANKPITGKLTSTWLHGAPARNLNAEMEVTISPAPNAFDKFTNYDFTDPVRSFSRIEIPVMEETKLSEEGETVFNKEIDIDRKAPGMLQATFLTKVFEGGGDVSIDVFSKKLAPYEYFVGLQAPTPHRYGSYYTDESTIFDVVSLDAKGNPAGNRKLEIKVFEIEWRWWWNRSPDNLSHYESTTTYQPFKELGLTTGADGKGQFTLNIPDQMGRRYLIRVIDKESGHATGKTVYFYRSWSGRPSGGDAESAKMLVFSADKEKYNVGEEAVITFPSGNNGKALVSIENGAGVLDKFWTDTQKGETQVRVPLTSEMAPNIYVNITLLQPHDQTKNNLPIRLYGVIPILVENPETTLYPQIDVPKVLKPETPYTVTVSEKNKRPMSYTLAVVDEGLLDLTRFTSPDIHKAFYSREALGVKTFDIFDYVIGAYSGSVENIYEIGGGDLAAGAKNRKVDRFKPVVTYIGPFTLKPGETASHKLLMPNYIGSVRIMLVAGDHGTSAYGSTDETVPVRKPLMVLASLPRKLSPGEKVTLPVTVFAMERKVKNVSVSVNTSNGLKPVGSTTKNITFNRLGEQIVNFEFEVMSDPKPQQIEVTASGAGEKASYPIEVSVVNPNPISQKSKTYMLEGKTSLEIDMRTFGVKGTNTASVEFSTLPPMDFSKRMEYLIRYPHGCVEQITSGAFPQLFLADIFDLNSNKKAEIQENISHAISILSRFQNPNGGLSYWPGMREADEWGSNYAGHFMLEAKAKGYALPITFLSNWITFQQTKARQWRDSYTPYNSSLVQAYRLYTLALAGHPELAAMNRLREYEELSNDAKWRLAAAYALAGKQDAARQIAAKANIDFIPEKYNYHTYGSPFRNRAMALETMVIMEDRRQRELAISLAKDLSSQGWYSTQETAYGLLSLSKMIIKNGGKAVEAAYTFNNKSETLSTQKALAERPLTVKMGDNKLKVENKEDNVLYVTLSQSGKLPLGEELTEQRNLSVKAQFLNGGGETLDVSALQQGSEIIAQIAVSNTSADPMANVALTQIFPSGWEIINTSFTELGGGATGDAGYKDIRDDRVNFYFNIESKETKVFTIKLNASYLGTYYLPGTQAEAMYDNTYFARTKGRWVQVVP